MISLNLSKLLRKRKAFDLIGLGPFAPWLLVALLFYGLRRLEVWLHQHIFKLGWLVTNQYQTTTILYYAFFLPGILLNQLTVWMVAGFLNVRAARSIAWPEKQETGELHLDFVQLSKNADPFRLALISTAPLIVGLVVTWNIANNILNVPAFLTALGRDSSLSNAATAAGKFTTAPDFWLWVYIAFTISNTMMPKFQNLRGWRILIGAAVVFIVALYAVGAGNQVVMNNLRGPVTDSVNALSSVFAIIIGLDIFMVGVLGTLEAIFERVTGDSATFENGKMITMRRSEMLAQRAKALAAPQPKVAKLTPAPAGPPSVYKLLFPIPGPPGKEAVTHDEGIIIAPDPNLSQPASSQPVTRSTPAIISGAVTEKLPASTEAKPSPLLGTPARPESPTEAKPFGSSLSGTPARIGSQTEAKPPAGMSPSPQRPANPTGATSPATGQPPRTPALTGTISGGGMQPPQPRTSSSTGTPSGTAGGAMPATPPRTGVPAGSTSPSGMRPAPTRPASPIGSGSPAGMQPPRPSPASPFAAPAARPQLPASKAPFDIDDEEDDQDEDDDVSYEDFEDPA